MSRMRKCLFSRTLNQITSLVQLVETRYSCFDFGRLMLPFALECKIRTRIRHPCGQNLLFGNECVEKHEQGVMHVIA